MSDVTDYITALETCATEMERAGIIYPSDFTGSSPIPRAV